MDMKLFMRMSLDTTVKLLFFSMRNFSDTSAASQLQHGRAIVGYKQRVDDEAEGLVVYDLSVGKKLGGHYLLEACDAQYGLCSSNERVVMGTDACSQMYSGMNLCGRQAFHARLSSVRLEPNR